MSEPSEEREHMFVKVERKASRALRAPNAVAPVGVEIVSVATAVPAHVITQHDAAWRAQKIFPQYARLDALYTNTGIDKRYAVEPVTWYLSEHSWEERTAIYQRNALDLLEQVSLQSIKEAGLAPRDIDVIVTNTITGLSIPSLEARLMNRIAFRSTLERLPIFGLGCGGGVGGLARAIRMAQAKPGANVLFLTVDLCSLCSRVNDPSLAMFVSAALFGDGAAGVVLRSDSNDPGGHAAALCRVGPQGEYFWSETEHIMGWDIKNDGFGVVLSPDLPALMRDRLGEALFPFLQREELSLQDFDGFFLHPGGRKVLETAEESLGLTRDQIRYSWQVLKQFGNMSSATALFVLTAALADGAYGRYLLAGFGPGFSAYFIVLDLHKNLQDGQTAEKGSSDRVHSASRSKHWPDQLCTSLDPTKDVPSQSGAPRPDA